MKGEAVESSELLGREVEEVFQVGSVTGGTRGKIVESREKTRALLLSKALDEYRPRKARPAYSWRQRDKLSTTWILSQTS